MTELAQRVAAALEAEFGTPNGFTDMTWQECAPFAVAAFKGWLQEQDFAIGEALVEAWDKQPYVGQKPYDDARTAIAALVSALEEGE